jgi:hypothetical protein
LNSLGGPSHFSLLLLSVKCKNLQIDSAQSREITEPNIGMASSQHCVKYILRIGFLTVVCFSVIKGN